MKITVHSECDINIFPAESYVRGNVTSNQGLVQRC